MQVPQETPRHWRSPALRKAGPDAAFQALAREALAQIDANARGVLASNDPEFLHQLRVGLRRLRSALRAFRGILGRKETKPLRRSLRRLSPQLGAARDWDVLVNRLESSAAAPELLARARREREHARKAAQRAITSEQFSKMQRATRSIAPQQSPRNLAQFGAAALARGHRKLMKEARGVDWRDPAARHAVRIRVKRLRYSCEFFAPAFAASKTTPYVGALKELQEILGELNDIAVARRLVGFDADETALLRNLEPAWRRFARRRPFWSAPA